MPSPARLLAPVAVMAVIFFLSAQPGLKTDLGTLDLVLRKAAHVAVFATLFLAWRFALPRRPPLLAAVLTVLYAISDEWHQSFVEDRVGSPVDVLIDTAGVALAWWASARWAPPRWRTGSGRAGR